MKNRSGALLLSISRDYTDRPSLWTPPKARGRSMCARMRVRSGLQGAVEAGAVGGIFGAASPAEAPTHMDPPVGTGNRTAYFSAPYNLKRDQ